MAPQPSAKGRRPSALRSPDDYAASRQRLRRIERDSFILIQHAYSLGAGTNEITVNPHRLLCDLGFTEEEVAQLVRYLYWVGFLRDTPAGPHLTLSEEAISYLEHERGRRCSVRCEENPDALQVIGIEQ